MQLSDIRDAVRERVGLPSTDGMAADAQMTEFVNSAIRQISIKKDWPWLEKSETISTVSGTAEYAPANDWRLTQRLTIDDTDLLYKGPRDLSRWNQFNGYPYFFTVERGKIILAPVPQEVYSITHVYTLVEPALVADGDEPNVPDWAIDIVIVTAAKLLATRLKDSLMIQLLGDEYRNLEKNITDEIRRARAFPTVKHRTDWVL